MKKEPQTPPPCGVIRVHDPLQTWRDVRGWGTNPLKMTGDAEFAPGSLHVVSLKPGAIRGNHRHPDSTEWMLVCDGPAELAWMPPGETEIVRELIAADDPALFRIPPATGHAIRNLAAHDITVVSFSNAREPAQVRCDPPLIAGQ